MKNTKFNMQQHNREATKRIELQVLEPKKLASLLRELGRRDGNRKAKTIDEAVAPGAEHFVIDAGARGLMIEMDSYVWNGRYWRWVN